MIAPQLSLVPTPHDIQSGFALLEAAGDQEIPDARLTAAERQFVTDLLAQLDEHLGVGGLMFLAGGAEHKAQLKRAEEAGRT